jgi:hypothetical protein
MVTHSPPIRLHRQKLMTVKFEYVRAQSQSKMGPSRGVKLVH